MKHHLKIEPEYFKEVFFGNKNFEIRLNDRDYQVGDLVVLNEIGTKMEVTAEITFITDFKQKIGYVVFGIKVIKGN